MHPAGRRGHIHSDTGGALWRNGAHSGGRIDHDMFRLTAVRPATSFPASIYIVLHPYYIYEACYVTVAGSPLASPGRHRSSRATSANLWNVFCHKPDTHREAGADGNSGTNVMPGWGLVDTGKWMVSTVWVGNSRKAATSQCHVTRITMTSPAPIRTFPGFAFAKTIARTRESGEGALD